MVLYPRWCDSGESDVPTQIAAPSEGVLVTSLRVPREPASITEATFSTQPGESLFTSGVLRNTSEYDVGRYRIAWVIVYRDGRPSEFHESEVLVPEGNDNLHEGEEDQIQNIHAMVKLNDTISKVIFLVSAAFWGDMEHQNHYQPTPERAIQVAEASK